MFDGISLNRPLWPHQVRALAALDRDVARGDRATYLVVPPGGGKTLIGLEAARRLGRPAVDPALKQLLGREPTHFRDVLAATLPR